MLVFVDESYHSLASGEAFTTFAALCLTEDNSPILARRLFNLKKLFWKVCEPTERELKGRRLLSNRGINLPKNRDLVEQLIALCKEVSAVPLAVIKKGPVTSLASRTDFLPEMYRQLLQRVNTFVSDNYPGQTAIMLFDARDDNTNQRIAVSFSNFLFRSPWGQKLDKVLDTPFFVNSAVTPGIQIADVTAYCVNQRYAGRRGFIEDFSRMFRELSFNREDLESGKHLWGFQRLPDQGATMEEENA